MEGGERSLLRTHPQGDGSPSLTDAAAARLPAAVLTFEGSAAQLHIGADTAGRGILLKDGKDSVVRCLYDHIRALAAAVVSANPLH